MPVVTKLGRVVTYSEGLPPIKSHGSLSTYSYNIMWQTEVFIYPLLQCPWPQNLVVWWLTVAVNSKATWSFGHMVLQDHVAS